MPAFVALALCVLIMLALALAVERLVLRPLVNQPDIILFMATIGLTYFLIGLGELIFGGEPKVMITERAPAADRLLRVGGAGRSRHLPADRHRRRRDRRASWSAGLALFFQKTRIGRALRAVADDHQAALSVGISLEPDLGDRLVRGRDRGAGDRHHVGRALGRQLRARRSWRSRRCRCWSWAA